MAVESLNSDVLQYHFLFAGLTEFVGSMASGFLCLRTQNLLGVSIVHWLLGLASIQAGLM